MKDEIGDLGIEGFTTREDQEEISRIEKQIRRRFVVGSQVSEHAIVQDFIRQVRQSIPKKDPSISNLLELFRTWYLQSPPCDGPSW